MVVAPARTMTSAATAVTRRVVFILAPFLSLMRTCASLHGDGGDDERGRYRIARADPASLGKNEMIDAAARPTVPEGMAGHGHHITGLHGVLHPAHAF